MKEQAVFNAALDAIKEPTYPVFVPWVLVGIWSSVRSLDVGVREYLRVRGRCALIYSFLVAFELCGDLEDGCSIAMFRTLEHCLLRAEILQGLLKKLGQPGVECIVGDDDIGVSGAFFLFVGGVWKQGGLAAVSEWVDEIFMPLIRAGLRAYHASGPTPGPKVSGSGGSCATDILILHRMRKLQIAKKKVPKSRPTTRLAHPLSLTPCTSPSSPTEDKEDDGAWTDDEGHEGEASAPGPIHLQPTLVGVSSPVTLEAGSSRKRKARRSEDNLAEVRSSVLLGDPPVASSSRSPSRSRCVPQVSGDDPTSIKLASLFL
ncbi:hypothetical protein B0H17DRAFT_705367 [Mycena rosella]|uniref:Uncharacterized protein n=1 Tax=Mycena rosella TaxID=1033263 RepID=A0AAD7DA98_MYCRO|nr:hypothetical protein B0H17DRAFT_705367 [Mycena rosella]